MLQSIKLVKREENFSFSDYRVSRIGSMRSGKNDSNDSIVNNSLVIRPKSKKEFVWIIVKIVMPTEEPGIYMDIGWRSYPEYILRSDQRCNYFRHYTLDLRTQQSYTLLCLPNMPKLEILFDVDFGEKSHWSATNKNIDVAEIYAYELALPKDTPLFQVGTLFNSEVDFSAAVIEVAKLHNKYLLSGIANKKDWSKNNTAKTLVKKLTMAS